MPEQVITFHRQRPEHSLPVLPVPTGKLAALGLFFRRKRKIILTVQWMVVFVYAFLVVVPAFLPLPPGEAHIWDNLRLFAQFVFWGIWWPGVMIATVTLGRVWCGFFCSEGLLTEWVSYYGGGR